MLTWHHSLVTPTMLTSSTVANLTMCYTGEYNLTCIVSFYSFQRRNAVPEVSVTADNLFDYDTDSDKVSDILEDDLERGSAVLAAFVVTLITVTFFGTLVAMISITMSVSGD